MFRLPAVLLLTLAGCGSVPAPGPEILLIPGTKLQIEMDFVPGTGTLSPFWISRRELTWADFDCFYEHPEEQQVDGITRPSSGKNYLQLSGLSAESMEAHRPVTNLRYHSAISYCEWLSSRSGLSFRLPTEREWESAPGTPAILQYCLEPDRPPDFGPVLRGPGRQTIPAPWDEADPNRPVSTWWFRAGHTQGFRVVRVPDALTADARKAYARKIEISGLKGEERTVKVGSSVALLSRVSGIVHNGGDRTLDEILLKVYFLGPRGKPHFEDVTSNLTRRATFNVCAPVLRNSAHPGEHALPLRPGERRSFVVDLPLSLDNDDDVQLDKFGASVIHLRFATD